MLILRHTFIALLFIAITFSPRQASAEIIADDGWLFGLNLGLHIPSGQFGTDFNSAIGYGINTLYGLNADQFFLDFDIFYQSHSLKTNASSTLSSIGFGGGLGYTIQVFDWLQPYASAGGGAEYVTLTLAETSIASSSYKPYGIGKLGIFSAPMDNLVLKLEGSYKVKQISNQTYPSMQAGLTVMFNGNFFGGGGNQLGRRESLVQISDVQLKPVFSARYAEYAQAGVGIVSVENVGRNPLYKVKVEAEVEGLTRKPTSTRVIEEIAAGDTKDLDVSLLFSQDILEVIESRDMPISLKVSYRTKSGVFSYKEYDSLLVHSKNALTWDDTTNLGSFVTPSESIAAGFSRDMVSEFKNDEVAGVPRNLQRATLLFNSLTAMNMTYVPDPANGFSQRGDDPPLDYVMFARETLNKRTGDCDDLTVLYATLLESIGIPTAIVTVPNHVLMMFDTKVPANNYQVIAEDKRLLHIRNGTVWIPIETTMVGKGFTEAWENAASTVAKYQGTGDYEAIELVNAWQLHPPADLGAGEELARPRMGKLARLYKNDLKSLRSFSYLDKLDSMLAQLKENPEDLALLNKVGVLFARTGELDKAAESFKKTTEINENYAAGYANQANVFILQKDFGKAVKQLEKAVALQPDNHKYQISLARAYFEQGQLKKAKEHYQIAQGKFQGYERLYSYLGGESEGSRASDQLDRLEQNLWE